MNMEKKKRDRLSNMPDVLLNKILSSLDMKTVIKASLISKRWRYLWLSTPYLNLKMSSNWNSLDKFSNFVDDILILRNPYNIHQLSPPTSLSHSWMLYEHIHLENLRFDIGRLSNLHVKTLTLSSVLIERSKFQEDVPFKLPFTENLVMSCCRVSSVFTSFIICAPRLKTVVLNETYGEQHTVIHIHSPALTVVKLKGNMDQDFYVEYVSSITTLDLFVFRMSLYLVDVFVTNLRKILTKIGNVEKLTLSIIDYEVGTAFAELQCELKKLRGPFGSVRYLELKNWHDNFSEADLLEIFPNVKNIKRK